MTQITDQSPIGWLPDGTKVEIIRSELNQVGILEYQIRPSGMPSFPSGITPWVPKYAVYDYDPLEEESPLQPNEGSA